MVRLCSPFFQATLIIAGVSLQTAWLFLYKLKTQSAKVKTKRKVQNRHKLLALNLFLIFDF